MALQEELKNQGDFLFRHRSYLPTALLVAGIGVKFYQERFNGMASEGLMGEVLEGSALIVGLLGLAIRVCTVGFAPDHTSGRNTRVGQVAAVLNTTGAYSVTRNPLYLGNYFMWIAVAMATGSMWFVLAFSLVFWLHYERIVFAEESFLRLKFGSTYTQWATRTPAFLPNFSNYVTASTAFSWRKVLRQEKNGLVALLFLLCLFGIVGDLAEGQLSFREERLSIAGAAFAAITYVLLKSLKKWTAVLSDEPKTATSVRRPSTPYSLMAKVFHWGFVVIFAYGLIRQVDEVEELENAAFLMEEIVFAVVFLVVLLARFVYMRSLHVGSSPGINTDLMSRLTRVIHLGMYLSLAMLAISGLVIGAMYASSITGGTAFEMVLWAHEACYWAGVNLIVLHVVIALYHRYRGTGVWNSMVPVLREKSNVQY